MKILVCDDDHAVRNTISIVLGTAGHMVEFAFDGQEALEKIRADKNSFDVLITDNNMPRLSGVNLVGKLRELSVAMPVIMISAFAVDPLTKSRLRLNGALSKPFTGKELLDCLKNLGCQTETMAG